MVKANDDTHDELEAHDGHEDFLGFVFFVIIVSSWSS
jgi:hypothetical protein